MKKALSLSLLILYSFCLNAKLTDYSRYYSRETLKALEDMAESPSSFLNLLQKDISNHQKAYSYKEARQYLFGQLHLEKNQHGYFVEDVYCGEVFTESDGVGEMQIPNHQKLNCEHTWPRSRFNPNYQREYQLTDLHHLFPSDSSANSSRSNLQFGEGVKKGEGVQNCPDSYRVSSNTAPSRFQVRPEHRGNVARAIFYFSVRYKIHIDNHEEEFLRQWHEEDPIDSAERERNNQIEKIQFNRNPFIDDPELVSKISDF